jgi:hypothetical protein
VGDELPAAAFDAPLLLSMLVPVAAAWRAFGLTLQALPPGSLS